MITSELVKGVGMKETESVPSVVRIHILPGGAMPERQTTGSIGYDVRIRAIVSSTEMDSQNTQLRQTMFDFKRMPDNSKIARHIITITKEHGGGEKLIYRMDPGESVLVGIGFITEMQFPTFFWVAPRSGLASKWGITVTNAPGTVDPDYRGEAGVLVYNRNQTMFDLHRGMRIAQIIFQKAVIPELTRIETYEELVSSSRGSGGFGSTGLS